MEEKITYSSLGVDDEKWDLFQKALANFSLGRRYPILATGSAKIAPSNRKIIVDTSPSDTDLVVARFPQNTAGEVEAAIDTASSACKLVKSLGFEKRLEILQNMRGIIARRAFEVAAIMAYEAGKTLPESLGEIYEVIAMIDAYEQFITEINFYRYELNDGSQEPYEQTLLTMEPLGAPVAIIAPFNFAFALCANQAMAAFLMGNPIIIKAASDTPLTTLQWRNIMIEAGVPEQACIFLTGPGSEVGEALIQSPRIAKVGLTGSLEVGNHIARVRAELGLHNSLVAELGGKNPVIVTPNADIEAAAHGILKSAIGFSGQKCSAASRVYVDRLVMADLIEALTDKKLREPIIVGDPRNRSTFMGPVINKASYENFRRIFDEVTNRWDEEKGLMHYSLRNGDACIDDSAGYFVPPMLITGIDHTDPLARDEHFLPIVTMHPVDSLQQALEQANDSQYGLTAGIFSSDEEELEYFFENIEAGVVYSNRRAGATTGAWPTIQSFGGWKNSGIGGLQAFGPHYLLNFARRKNTTRVLR